MSDSEKVLQILEVVGQPLSYRLLADALGWKQKVADSPRVQAALLELAASKRVTKVGKKWCLIK